MTATAKLLPGGILLAWSLSAVWVDAGDFSITAGAVAASNAVAQFGGYSQRRQAEELLDQARDAMQQGQLDLAETLIARAERLDVKHDHLFGSLRDTPAKARQDLARLRAGDGPVDQRPSVQHLPMLLHKPTDETAGRTDPFQAPGAPGLLATLPNPDQAAAAKYLERARAEMARDNMIGALSWYYRAKKLNVEFGPDEDSPERLAADLRQRGVTPSQLSTPDNGRSAAFDVAELNPHQIAASDRFGPAAPREVTAAAEPRPLFVDNPYAASTETAPRPAATAAVDDRREQARHLLVRARLELAADDAQRAAQFVAEAKSLEVVFGTREDSPGRVQDLIQRFHTLGQGNTSAGQFHRRHAELLMQQADALAYAYGQLDVAEKLARRADQIRAEFRPDERGPRQLIDEIARLRSEGRPGHGSGPAEATAQGSDTGAAATQQRKQRALALMAQARAALDRNEIDLAYHCSAEAQNLRVPESEFDGQSPEMLLMRIERERQRRGSGVVQASALQPVDDAAGGDRRTNAYPVAQGDYNPATDPTRNVPAQATGPSGAESGRQLLLAGEQALTAGDGAKARQLFQQAWKFEAELDAQARQRLQDHLQTRSPAAGPPRRLDGMSPLEEVDAQQKIVLQQMVGELTREQSVTDRMKTTDPFGALERLKELRQRFTQADLDRAMRTQLLSRVDRSIESIQRYIDENRSQIELDERNDAVMATIDRERQVKQEIQDKLAEIVDEFNTLMDQQRWEEAEVMARQARELDPENEVVMVMTWKSRFARRVYTNLALQQDKEEAVWRTLDQVERSAIPFSDDQPYVFGDVTDWNILSERRRRLLNEHARGYSQSEIQIQEALKQKVEVRFIDSPLSEVLQTLGKAAGINVLVDQPGLAAEGLTSNQPVTINLTHPIALRSALNHILQPLSLSYVIQDEVLKITSEQTREAHTYPYVYDVADLVIPIPNFVPSYGIGLPGAIREAHNAIGYGPAGFNGNNVPLALLANNQSQMPPQSTSALAQMGAAGIVPSMSGTRAPQPVGFGPGGLGGASQADFDTLIELITSTIAPTTWTDAGGSGSIEGFDTNLSLVVSQTQEVHEEIVDLLEQLRRLQDLQVTIEVRFITLQDNFFERIGIDFDFEIDDNITTFNPRPDRDTGPAVTIGLDPTGAATVDLDLPFDQGSFGTTIPQFGGFDAATAANFGFAILSDIETFVLIQAAQGDSRTNIMQAPKVTLFNGQQAFVSDTSQRPFVTSVIPVVGDFAAAQQPVIVVLTEGTSLSVQAVVSPDRRFVRLTLVPFFSRIGDVQEFTFEGQVSSNSGNAVVDPTDEEQTIRDAEQFNRVGTTVQLPTFSFVTVTTTVSVPDGGTVLLGGIKRLSEGRDERGVPIVSKLPYINRLFRNVGIGRTAQSLMMMVTPRIIIQEEEEEKLGIPPPP